MGDRMVFRGARLVDPAAGVDGLNDILVEDGRIAGIGEVAGGDAEVIDCTGLIVSPGLVDMHTHLREPGFEHKETIETGTRAAARRATSTSASMLPARASPTPSPPGSRRPRASR